MNRFIISGVAFLLSTFYSCTPPAADNAPANAPGELKIKGDTVIFGYGGADILTLIVSRSQDSITVSELKDTRNEKVTHLFTITSQSGKPFFISGQVTGSKESFTCEAERKIEGTQAVRHVYGPSHNNLNRAVYDRGADWFLSADQSYTSADLTVMPEVSDSITNRFRIEMTGSQVTFRFRPRYFQKHRGLSYFEPWKYSVWKESVAGWCSWFAFKTGITEENIKQTADIVSESMKPYGLEYFQIDDGYQQVGGQPEHWIVPNDKFPSGLESLAAYIKARGLKPGIWTNVAVDDSTYVASHKQWFVTDPDGIPASGRWIGFPLDGSNPVALDSMISPVYRRFSETGWEYFKLDALRHLLFEGYNSHSQYFEKAGINRETAFRNVVERVREDVGRENFLLSCWGVLPAVVGIVDGCRIGNDGYGYAALAQYNSFNNVIWRNDPDHIELTTIEAYRSCMVTSLTGSLFMVTDKPGVYETKIIEPARKSLPVLFTMPGQLFDLDPSRSMLLDRTMTEMSGSGERAADGSRNSPIDLFVLELNMPWENWMVLGRTGTVEKEITLEDLGLKKGTEYHVYEFWSYNYLGSVTEKLVFEDIDPGFNCQLYCFREKKDHPQIVATDRHISCGATDLSEVRWENRTLSGRSKPVKGDSYKMVVYEPDSYNTKVITARGCKILSNIKKENIRTITLVSFTGDEFKWRIDY